MSEPPGRKQPTNARGDPNRAEARGRGQLGAITDLQTNDYRYNQPQSDIGIDCAGMADGTAPLWDPHNVTTLMPKKRVTEEDKEEMNRKFQGSMEEGDQGDLGLEARGAVMMTAALQGAVDGTIANNVQQRQCTGGDGGTSWMHIYAWCKKMNSAGACSALKRVRTMPDGDKLQAALRGARWPHTDIPTGI